MGLDVYLYQFSEVDAGAILNLSDYYDELCGTGSNQPEWKQIEIKLQQRASELSLPIKNIDNLCDEGVEIHLPSQKHPDGSFAVGEWESGLDFLNEMLRRFIHRDFYYLFPEAEGDPALLRPNWIRSRVRTIEILDEFKKLNPAILKEFEPVETFADQDSKW
jgi:hypothetical protein